MSFHEGQRQWLGGLSSAEMAAGTKFPIEKVNEYLNYQPNLHVWDIGCGYDIGQMAVFEACGYHVRGLDINRQAIHELSDYYHFWADLADATSVMGFDYKFELVSWLERVDAVIVKGLMPSLLGDNWKHALDAIDMWLRPGGALNNSGYLFVAEIWDASKPYNDIDKNNPTKWENYQQLWEKRLYRNYQALGDNFPYGTFAVGGIGPTKNWLDWEATPEQIRYVYENRHDRSMQGVFERLARHVDRTEFIDYMTNNLGYSLLWEDAKTWQTRGDVLRPVKEIPGGTLVFRKPSIYRFDPIGVGCHVDEVDLIERRSEIGPPLGDALDGQRYYWSRLLERVPFSQKQEISSFASLCMQS